MYLSVDNPVHAIKIVHENLSNDILPINYSKDDRAGIAGLRMYNHMITYD